MTECNCRPAAVLKVALFLIDGQVCYRLGRNRSEKLRSTRATTCFAQVSAHPKRHMDV
jgi:hypothetical protein